MELESFFHVTYVANEVIHLKTYDDAKDHLVKCVKKNAKQLVV